MRHCRLNQKEKFAIAEHFALNDDHTKILSNENHYFPRLYSKAIEINKHKNSFNKKEESLKISDTWMPVLHKNIPK